MQLQGLNPHLRWCQTGRAERKEPRNHRPCAVLAIRGTYQQDSTHGHAVLL